MKLAIYLKFDAIQTCTLNPTDSTRTILCKLVIYLCIFLLPIKSRMTILGFIDCGGQESRIESTSSRDEDDYVQGIR